ncbi:hypothetical protein PRIPAC_87099, partial [Pristionchus pacificus]
FRFIMNGRPTRTCVKPVDYAGTSTQNKIKEVKSMTTHLPHQFSPTELAQMLEALQKEIPGMSDSDKVGVELKGFNAKDVTTYEEYCRLRDSIMEKTGHPDFDEGGRTALNVDAAAIAGAKMVIDNARSTRAFSKQLMASTGVNENDILYKGISNEGTDLDAAKAVSDNRKASLMESLVDFQKQIQFKMSVLKHIEMDTGNKQKKIAREISKSDGPITRRGKNEEQTEHTTKKGLKRKMPTSDLMKTPKQSQELNPLDDKRIYDEYACNIASELREERKKRRRTAPIPFNIHLLDETEEDEE